MDLEVPWEVVYGPDNYLWISEEGGKVFRVHPETGDHEIIYTASDYFPGDESEDAPCGRPIGGHTYGLALHPDFLGPDSSFIYFIYSYNAGTDNEPATLFKIVKLTWDPTTEAVTGQEDLVTELANGYDHWGGRLLAVKQNGINYLYYSTGDTGANDESCYDTPADNPNNFTQDPYNKIGKIHRVNMDGTIPEDNPISGNSFFTRGHRNPQGLAYNPNMNVLYDIEHGHTTDDEINVLEAGMNYGWKNVKGYHDGNYPDELDFVQNYVPHPDIPNDSLREPLFSWGAVTETGGGFLTWPTVAPSDGIYYGSDGIPEWTNSLLVVTLKDGTTTDREVFQFKLNPDGVSLAESTPEEPNPQQIFGEDQGLNGRLRDIAISPDGKKIFLLTANFGALDPIIVYTYNETTAVGQIDDLKFIVGQHYPNPFSEVLHIPYELKTASRVHIEIMNTFGQRIKTLRNQEVLPGKYVATWDGTEGTGQALPNGIYFYSINFSHIKKSGRILLIK